MRRIVPLPLLALLLLSMACSLFSLGAPQPTASPAPPTLTPLPPTAAPPTPIPTPSEGKQPEEAILILQPGAGSRLRSPLRVTGVANPTFEGHLTVRVLGIDGVEVASQPAIIQAEIGERGPFSTELPFAVSGEQPALVQVYATSPRDGGLTHLSSVYVTLAAAGPEQIIAGEPHPEAIVIRQPAPNATVSGGVAPVAGFGLASFEGTLVIEIHDTEGTLVGLQPVIVNAPEMGQPGPFSADVPYTVSAPGPGRVVVRDPSPAFGGDVHLSSVEIILAP